MTEIAVLVGDMSGRPEKSCYAGMANIRPYNPSSRTHDSHLEYMGFGVRRAIKESLKFDHNIAKVTKGAVAYQFGGEYTYSWDEITRSAPDEEYTAGSDWDWDSSFPHPESASIPDSTRRYIALGVNAQSMPNRFHFLGEQAAPTPAIALKSIVRRFPDGPDACRRGTHYVVVYDFTHRSGHSWESIGFPRDDAEVDHDGTDFLHYLPHRDLEEAGKELTTRPATDEDGNPQSMVTTTSIDD